MRVRLLVLSLSLMLSGCTGLAGLAQTLNDRQVISCLWYSGAAGPWAQVRGVTATGGALLDGCLKEGR